LLKIFKFKKSANKLLFQSRGLALLIFKLFYKIKAIFTLAFIIEKKIKFFYFPKHKENFITMGNKLRRHQGFNKSEDSDYGFKTNSEGF